MRPVRQSGTNEETARMARVDPLRNFRFRVEIDGIALASFSEVTIGDTTVDTIDYREGTDPPHVRKLSGLTRFGTVTLKRGLVTGGAALDLYRWQADVAAGLLNDRRKRVIIVAQNEQGQDAVRFVVSEAWPVKYAASPLNATGNDVLIETLELANEGIERDA
jgi:phage tail-like protein